MMKIIWSNVWRNKHRSLLTLLGIVIGVGAIVSLVSVSVGLGKRSADVMKSFQGVYVLEDGAADMALSHVDKSYANKIRAVPGVKLVVPEIWGNAQGVEGAGDSSSPMKNFIFIVGIDPDKSKGYDIAPYYDASEGRRLTSSDRKGVVIGKGLKDMFNLFVGSTMKLNGKTYQVVGVFESKSRLFNFMIVTTLDTARDITGFDSDKVSAFQVIPNNPKDVANLKARIDSRFSGKLQALSMQDSANTITGFIGNLTIALWFVSGIAGLVGGIGVMNTMLMSVMERIQEFGVLKAIGWRDRDVMLMILLESLLLSVVGGLIGVGLGVLVSSKVAEMSNIPSAVDPTLIFQAMLFAVVMGFAGGLYPGYKSTKMSPVEAVRRQ